MLFLPERVAAVTENCFIPVKQREYDLRSLLLSSVIPVLLIRRKH
jgi:hypothetical protein